MLSLIKFVCLLLKTGLQLSLQIILLHSVLFSSVIICAASWENQQSAYAKTKAQISFAVTAKLIIAFVFATRIVQLLYFLNPKFRASSQLLCLYSSVFVEPVQKPHRWFSHKAAHINAIIACILEILCLGNYLNGSKWLFNHCASHVMRKATLLHLKKGIDK